MWLFSADEKGDGDGELARRMAYCMLGERGEAGGNSGEKRDAWERFCCRWRYTGSFGGKGGGFEPRALNLKPLKREDDSVLAIAQSNIHGGPGQQQSLALLNALLFSFVLALSKASTMAIHHGSSSSCVDIYTLHIDSASVATSDSNQESWVDIRWLILPRIGMTKDEIF